MFRGREMSHPERGRALLERLAEDVSELGVIESAPIQDGRNMVMLLAPVRELPPTKPGANEAPEAGAEAPKPEAAKPEAAEPAAVKAKTPAPKAAAPKAAAPKAAKPRVTKPKAAAPEAEEPTAAADEVAEPAVAAPEPEPEPTST
jgi:translation initiation factor IF-3